MTKTPRNVSGEVLCRRLAKLGCFDDHHHGDHFIMTTLKGGEHHVSVPQHKPIKVKTLNNILKDLQEHHKLKREELLSILGL